MNNTTRRIYVGLISGALVLHVGFVMWIWITGSNLLLHSGTPSILIALGRLTGLLGTTVLLVQLLFIGRFPLTERLFGFARLNRIHRIVGYSTAFFLFTHPLLLIVGYSSLGQVGYYEQLKIFLQDWHDILGALVGLGLFTLVILFSLPAVRRRLRYEAWHGVHFLTYLALFLVFSHQTNYGDFTDTQFFIYWNSIFYVVVGGVLTMRFVRPFLLWYRHRFRIHHIVMESHDVASIYISGRNVEEFRFRAGQFAFLTFLNSRVLLDLAHPFSFSSSRGSSMIRFTIKVSGDFTKRIKTLSAGTPVVIDGPLGNFTLEQSWGNKFLFIAGGIGITPFVSMVTELGVHDDVMMFYAARTSGDLVFGSDLEKKLGNRLHYFISREISGGGGVSSYKGKRITVEAMHSQAPDLKERDIYVCGPPGMVRELTRDLLLEQFDPRRLHSEVFSLS